MQINSRQIAFDILYEINNKGAYSNLAFNKFINDKTPIRDENLAREIVYGVLENKNYIDYIIKKASNLPFRKIHDKILEILRVGVYQLVFLSRIPESAAVNESVKLAKRYGHRGSVAFVNGLLREIAGNKDKYLQIDTEDRTLELSIKYSYPEFIIKKWIDEFGEEFTENLCRASNERPKMNIRVNTLKTDREFMMDLLKKKGLDVKKGKYSEDCLIINNSYKITDSDEFKKGMFTIQDEASMLVSNIMNPSEEKKIIDICSAPGGKSTHLAQIMNNKGYILARDIHNHKFDLIEDNIKRLGIEIIKSEIYDGLKLDENLIGKFDYCLLDAPCSGFGIVRRKPEIKYNRKEEDIKALSKIQYKMLNLAKDYLKIGGILLYSTCTIVREENSMIIDRFLKENENFKLVNLNETFHEKNIAEKESRGYIQLFPNIHATDGFFIAKLIKER